MASRTEGFWWLAVLVVVAVTALYAVPLSAWERVGARQQPGDGARPADGVLASSGVPATADAVIEEMAQAAGVIFVAEVVAVRHPSGFAGSAEAAGEGIVEVDFRVDQAVRGPATGSIYTLREWSGLWAASGAGERYQIGQRLLVFLYEPNEGGLSSPVNSRDGAVPLRGGGAAPGPDDSTTSAAQWMVDVRWLRARALVRRSLGMLPVRMPISPGPIRGPVSEEKDERREVEVVTALARRVPLPEPLQMPTSALVDMEPLEQVLLLCQQSMRQANVVR